jgi:oligopeptide/dipeptide ABC transporter ATP-binding protein
MGDNEELIRIKNLKTHLYTINGIVKAVDGIDFHINQGETLGLVGESGCGKSMTALSIMRLLPELGKTIEGNVLFKNNDLLQLSEEEMRKIRGKEISMVFQDPLTFLNPVFKVGDQITEAILLNQKVPKKEAKVQTIEYLRMTGIPSPERVALNYPHQLSGGMRQRVLIAMALSSHPALLIADEPTSALDVTVQAQILELIKKLRDDMGLSMLMITHDMGVVAEICDRACIMYAGKIVENGEINTLYEEPKHPYTIGLFKSVLKMEYKKRFETIGGSVPDLTKLPKGCRFNPRCSRATDICKEKEPPTVSIEKGHSVNCWLYTGESK